MPHGLQCFDAQGRVTLDTNDSISKLVGSFVTQEGVAGSINVPELAGGSRIFTIRWADVPQGPGYQGALRRSEITISGRTINWTAGRGSITVRYGVY